MNIEDLHPPDKPDEFFPWLKKASEEHWESVEINRGVFGFQIQKGTKWLRGLTEEEIAKYEKEMGLSFPEIYKLYLRHMNGTDKPTINVYGECGEPYQYASGEADRHDCLFLHRLGNAGCCNIDAAASNEVIKMDKQQLREQLEQLHSELAQVKTLDRTEAEMLQHLAGDIREILEREENHAQHYSGLGERLNEAVARLEASHPRATDRMRQVIDQLAYLGI